MGDGSIKGASILEACALLAKNGSYWWYPNQTGTMTAVSSRRPCTHSIIVIVANDSMNFFGNGAAGLIGLGRSSGGSSFIDTVFNYNRGWNNLTIGIALNPKGATEAGEMDLTKTDPSLYTGQLKFNPIVPAATDVPTNYPADWSLHLDSWTVDTGNVKTEYTTGGIAIVEPYFPEIRFPQDQALLFCTSLSHSCCSFSLRIFFRPRCEWRCDEQRYNNWFNLAGPMQLSALIGCELQWDFILSSSEPACDRQRFRKLHRRGDGVGQSICRIIHAWPGIRSNSLYVGR